MAKQEINNQSYDPGKPPPVWDITPSGRRKRQEFERREALRHDRQYYKLALTEFKIAFRTVKEHIESAPVDKETILALRQFPEKEGVRSQIEIFAVRQFDEEVRLTVDRRETKYIYTGTEITGSYLSSHAHPGGYYEMTHQKDCILTDKNGTPLYITSGKKTTNSPYSDTWIHQFNAQPNPIDGMRQKADVLRRITGSFPNLNSLQVER